MRIWDLPSRKEGGGVSPGLNASARTCGKMINGKSFPRLSILTIRGYITMSFRAFRGSALTTVRFGLA